MGNIWNSISNVYHQLGNHDQAIESDLWAALLHHEAFDDDHFRIGFDYYGIALAHWDCKNWQDAQRYAKDAYKILSRMIGKMHLLTRKCGILVQEIDQKLIEFPPETKKEENKLPRPEDGTEIFI